MSDFENGHGKSEVENDNPLLNHYKTSHPRAYNNRNFKTILENHFTLNFLDKVEIDKSGKNRGTKSRGEEINNLYEEWRLKIKPTIGCEVEEVFRMLAGETSFKAVEVLD